MGNDIFVQSETIASKLQSFKDEMTKLEALFEKINTETTAAKDIWEGNASDSVLSEIEKYKQVADSIKSKNKEYANFLNVVIEKYTDFDDTTNDTISSGDNIFNVDYMGK